MPSGIRKELSDSLGSFIQTLQPVPPFVERLEIFRTQTLAELDPIDKKKQAVNAVMDELLDSAVGLDSFVIAEIPISNSRAALYVYLNATVSCLFHKFTHFSDCLKLVGRPVLDDTMLDAFLNNRYQVWLYYIIIGSISYSSGKSTIERN